MQTFRQVRCNMFMMLALYFFNVFNLVSQRTFYTAIQGVKIVLRERIYVSLSCVTDKAFPTHVSENSVCTHIFL